MKFPAVDQDKELRDLTEKRRKWERTHERLQAEIAALRGPDGSIRYQQRDAAQRLAEQLHEAEDNLRHTAAPFDDLRRKARAATAERMMADRAFRAEIAAAVAERTERCAAALRLAATLRAAHREGIPLPPIHAALLGELDALGAWVRELVRVDAIAVDDVPSPLAAYMEVTA